jgi:hypothetical protein
MGQDLMFALAIIAYQAYGESVEWKNYQGLPMPRWEELGPAIQQAWLDAAAAVRDAVAEEIGQKAKTVFT